MKTVGYVGVALVTAMVALGCSQQKAGVSTTSGTTAVLPTSVANEAKFVPYETAVQEARSQNKYIFVDIYTDWCVWCKRLDQNVYTNAAVQQAFAKNFAITKMNAESKKEHTYDGSEMTEQEIADKWNVTGFPTLVFLDQTEKPVFAYIGYLPADKMVKLLDFVSSGAFKQSQDFDGWLKSHSS